jgi:hypothetical protein
MRAPGKAATSGMSEDKPREGEPSGRVSAVAVIKSVLSAAFGVQSSRNQQRDFTQGNYRHFIIGGIVFTVLFVLTLVLVVNLVLA